MTTIRQAIESTFRQFIAPDIIGIKNDLAAIQNTLKQIIKNTAVTNVAKSLIDARDSVVNVSVGAVNVAPNITQKLEADVTVNVKLPEGLVDVLGDLKISLEGKLSTIETLLQGIKSCIGGLKTDFKTYFEKNMPSILDVLHQIKVCVCEARSKDCGSCEGGDKVNKPEGGIVRFFIDLINVIASLIAIFVFGKNKFKGCLF